MSSSDTAPDKNKTDKSASSSISSPKQANKNHKGPEGESTVAMVVTPTPEQKQASSSSATQEAELTAAAEEAEEEEEEEVVYTYQGTKASSAYQSAKSDLADGDFERALSTLETALSTTLESDSVDGDELHESLGLLYYLYGTTLLYSIEENTTAAVAGGAAAGGNVEDGLMVQPPTTTTTPPVSDSAVAASAEDKDTNGKDIKEDGDHDEESKKNGTPAVAAASTDSNEPPASEQATAAASASAEEMQIAWENLESARNVLQRLLTETTKTTKSEDQNANQKKKDDASQSLEGEIMLDLAQVYLRLGDLQRFNGRYLDAIRDYRSCLNLRTLPFTSHELGKESSDVKDSKDQDKLFEGCKDVRYYTRPIADCHYSLGMTYLLHAADAHQRRLKRREQQQQQQQQKQEQQSDAKEPSADPAVSKDQEANEERDIEHARDMSVHHYLACGRSIAGIAALRCGVKEVATFLHDSAKQQENKTKLKEDETQSKDTNPTSNKSPTSKVVKEASTTLAQLRAHVAPLQAPAAPVASKTPTKSPQEEVHDLKELLDEIQETIDNVEESVKVLRDVEQMRCDVEAQADAEQDSMQASNGKESAASFKEGTTATATAATTTTIGFGAAAEAKAGTVQQPNVMMVRKKSRKRPASTEGKGDVTEGSKRGKSENGSEGDRKKVPVVPTE